MDDPYLDSRSSRRVWEERPRGPFEVNEPLPKPVQLWKSSTNLATNKPQELLHFKWQRNAATRVLESLELHTYEWTVRAIKTRESLDKLDRRDIALSTFAMSRNKDLIPTALDIRALNLDRAEDDTAELRQAAARNNRLLQVGRINELIADAGSIIVEADRAALLSACSMDHTEFQIFLKMTEVYDLARSHFLFEIVDPQVKRFLNAERLKAEALNPPVTLTYDRYKEMFLARTLNSELTQDLLSYILKPREEACPVYLWVAERISESNLLTANGLNMSNQAWLAYTIAFITHEERLILQVPSLQEREAYDGGRGYELTDLEAAINTLDVTTLKAFRQNACQDPVAMQILKLDKLQSAAGSSSAASNTPSRDRQHTRKPQYPPRKEQYAASLPPKAKERGGRTNGGNRLPQGEQLAKLETISALPHKEGRLDMDAYSKYKEGGLRRKIHDAIRAKKCIRCFAEGHLRSSCKEPPRSWEGDFNKGKESFWKPQPKQSRPQWHVSPVSQSSNLLSASLHGKTIVLDTASEISIGRMSFLKNVRLAETSTFVEGVGGKTFFDLEGDLPLDEKNFITVFAVEEGALPPNSWALIGNGHLRDLFVSLDYAQANPGRPLQYALDFESLSKASLGPRSSVFGTPFSGQRVSDLNLCAMAISLLLASYCSLAAVWPSLSSVSGETLFLNEVCALAKGLVVLSLARLVWLAPELLLVPLPSKAGVRERTQPHFAPESLLVPLPSKVRPSAGVRERTQRHLTPPCSYRSKTSPPMSAGQRARFGAMLGSHSRNLISRRHAAITGKLFDLAEGVYGRNPAPKATRNQGTFLKAHLRPYPRNLQGKSEPTCPVRKRPLLCAKKYFSPRDARPRQNTRPTVANPNHYSNGEANSRPTVANPNHYSNGEANPRPKVASPNHYSNGEANSRPKVANPNHYSNGEANSRPTVANHKPLGRSELDAQPRRINAGPSEETSRLDLAHPVCTEVTCGHCRAYGPGYLHPFMRSRDASAFYVEAEILPADSRHAPVEGTKGPAPLQCWMMHVERTEIAKAMQARQSSSTNAKLKPRPAWMMDTSPRRSDDEADWIWQKGNDRLLGPSRPVMPVPPPPIPSSFAGGNTIKVRAQIGSDPSEFANHNVAIDTQSDVTTALAEHLTEIKEIVPDQIHGVSGAAVFKHEGRLHIWSNSRQQTISLPALVASRHQLPFNCIALLGVPAILKLEIAVEQHLKLPQFSPLICHLGEKRLREWLEHHPDAAPDTAPFDIKSILINPELTRDQISRVKATIREYAHVFEGHENSLPKPFHTEPITLKLKADAKPQSIPQPRWTVAQAKIVTRWAEEGLKNGSLELSSSAWSSRLHLVLKAPSNVTAELADIKDCKLRPCGDYRLVNTQIEKMAPNLPTGLHQLERAAGHNIYFEADSVACYNSFRLAPGISREALAIWTPIGLVQPTVLPFGQKNSGTEAQGPYLNAAKRLKKISNYVDDWLGFSDDFEELLENFKEFLKVCLEYNITLNASKTKFGFPSAQFFGFVADKDGTRLADKHLCPIKNMVPPEDIAELRRTLGLFVVSRKYIANYAMITKPLTDLLRGKQPMFMWEKAHQQAYEHVRDALLAGLHLAAPNFDFPFHLQTDASEDGKGAILYQLLQCAVEEQYPYCKKLHAPDMISVIAYLSKAFSEAQRLRPPYYLEADSLLWATNEVKFYALSSRFPLHTYSDHMPLQWMRKSEKGPVSQFLVEQLAEIETKHQYIQGELNSLADAASRYPLLGPKRLAPRGLANSVREALARLPAYLRDAKDIQVHAGTYTSDLKVMVQAWVTTSKGSVQPVAPTRKGPPTTADFVVFVPRPEDSPVTLALYLVSSIPFAILIPNDLLAETYAPRIYPEADCNLLKTRFEAAGKIQILSTQMTWVIGNVPEYNRIEMFMQSLRTAAPLTGNFNPVIDETETFTSPMPTTLEEWITEQQRDEVFLQSLAAMPTVACRNGLYLFAPDEAPPRIFVPPQTREPLIRFVHAQMFHLGHAKVAERLSRSYFWPKLRGDTRKILDDCPECEIEKARRNQAHGLFRARPHDAPRTRFAMDFQGQGLSTTGQDEALAIIDTTTRYVTVIPMKGREAKTFMPLFLDNIVFRYGPPLILHCDEAPEFMSNLVKEFLEVSETSLTTTMGHNARSNGVIEVFWRFWNRCMRLLTDDQYAHWPDFRARICFAYNTAPHSSIGGISPHEVDCGTPARDTFSAILNESIEILPQLPDEEGDAANARLFALAVKTSTQAFVQLARNHDQYVRDETAALLNSSGHPRTFIIGDQVKARFPPTQAELLATGRRSSHVSSWRGPCRIVERLSSTSYSIMQLDTGRQYERLIGNLLPWKATSVRQNKKARYDPAISTPFVTGEFIAIRDEPGGWFFLAQITTVGETFLIIHYFGTRSEDLAKAKFYPTWHLQTQQHITLSPTQPDYHIKYSGIIELDSINELIIARGLKLTAALTLNSKSRRQIMPVRDELFIYE